MTDDVKTKARGFTSLPSLEQAHANARDVPEAAPNGWIERHGGERPVPEDTEVMVRLREGTVSDYWRPADRFDWRRSNSFPAPADIVAYKLRPASAKVASDGSTASYYELPEGASELQHLISHRNMNAQIGEIFRSCYRMGIASHSGELRDAKKILFYAKAEVERLEKSK